MQKRLLLLLVGVFFFIQFIFFSYLVHKGLFKQFDFDNTVRLQEHVSRRFDEMFSVLSEIGKFEIMSIVLLVLLILRRKILGGLLAISLFVGFHAIELYGKFFVDHLPPPQFMLRTKHLVDFPQFHVRSENSYPSGHAGRAAFISAIVFVLLWQSKRLSPTVKLVIALAVVCYDIAMVISRVYLGEHWSSDVIGGTLLGLSFGLLSSILLTEKEKHAKVKGLFPKLPRYKIEIKKVE